MRRNYVWIIGFQCGHGFYPTQTQRTQPKALEYILTHVTQLT